MSDMRSPKVTRDSNEAGKHLWRAPQVPGMGEMSHEREFLFFHILASLCCHLCCGCWPFSWVWRTISLLCYFIVLY